jgi:mono/diheme cytochrome c family protein
VQAAALAALGRFGEGEISEPIVAAWRGMSPALRLQGAELLLSRAATAAALVAALESGDLTSRDLDPSTIQRLKTHADAAVRERAVKALAVCGVDAGRGARGLSDGRWNSKGMSTRAATLFRKHCAVCHRREGVWYRGRRRLGHGPHADARGALGERPRPESRGRSEVHSVQHRDRRRLAHSGVVSAETASTVTLTGAEKATQTVPRADIDVMESTGLSLMPEGFEREIDPQGMADLIAYLRSDFVNVMRLSGSCPRSVAAVEWRHAILVDDH